jgi:hypothetical protein
MVYNNTDFPVLFQPYKILIDLLLNDSAKTLPLRVFAVKITSDGRGLFLADRYIERVVIGLLCFFQLQHHFVADFLVGRVVIPVMHFFGIFFKII